MVSIIVPTYNRSKVIGRAIQSILCQTYPYYEIIIVDDGSTDNTQEVVERMSDDRIRYIRLEQNQGACHARNVGIRESRYDYIAFLDSDDEWMPEKLQVQMQMMRESPEDIGLIYCRMKQESAGKEKYTPSYDPPKDMLEGNMFRFLLWKNVIGTPAMLMRKELLQQIGGFKETLQALQDWELVLRIAKNWNIGFVEQPLVRVHKSANSISRQRGIICVIRCWIVSQYRREMAEFGILELVKEDILEMAQKFGIETEIKELLGRDFEL